VTALAGVGDTVAGGSLLLAVPIALLAGLVSFLSPCVLPLVPGYLSYVTGLTGADLAAARRGRVLLGGLLFVLGFTAVFVSFGALFGGLGSTLLAHERVITRVLGLLTIVLGLSFMGVLGAVPFLRRELRWHRRGSAGLAGAPMLGALFGLGWTPCLGPTLTAALALSYDSASAGRGALLTAAYCLGLGAPFLLAAVAFRRAMGAFGWVRRHNQWVMRAGGGMLVALGIMLVTGLWGEVAARLRVWTSSFGTLL
jgi:cytochrome c-type biogenesis protein